MEILLLGIYSFFVWLIFFKFKWLPWNFVSQVIVVTRPIIGLTAMVLVLNIVAPSSHDARAVNYFVQVVPRVSGRVLEVPVEPNQPVKKGDGLFKIDPTPYEQQVKAIAAKLPQLQAQLISAQACQRELEDQFKSSGGKKAAMTAKLGLARLRVGQTKELAEAGAGSKFDYEQAEADVKNFEVEPASADANEAQVGQKLSAKTEAGELAEVAQARALMAQTEAQLAEARWTLEQATVFAPANGTVVNLQLRAGSYTVPMPMSPAMTFVEDEQWIMAFYRQNELRQVNPGQEAEVALRTYPGRIIQCKADSVVWASGEGMLPIAGMVPNAPAAEGRFPVRLLLDGKDKDLFVAAGARGQGAICTDKGEMLHILRKVILRVGSKLDWLILKLH
jgi:multidrug resistance efflux pump